MATTVLTNAFVEVDDTVTTTNLSGHVRSLTLNYAADMIEDTNMGDNTRQRIGGLKDWSVELELAQDFAATVDPILFDLVGTTFTVTIRPDSAVKSTTNPEFTGTGILESYPPFGNPVGELATTTVTIQAAGDLQRSTS